MTPFKKIKIRLLLNDDSYRYMNLEKFIKEYHLTTDQIQDFATKRMIYVFDYDCVKAEVYRIELGVYDLISLRFLPFSRLERVALAFLLSLLIFSGLYAIAQEIYPDLVHFGWVPIGAALGTIAPLIG